MRNMLFLFILFASFFIECKKNDTSSKQVDPLLLHKWILTSIQNTKTNQIINYPDSISKKESVTFTDSASLFFFGGVCNGGQGKYSVSGNSITLSSLSITQIYCRNYNWEAYLKNNLDSAFQYKISDKQLTIYSKGTYNLNFVINP